MVKVDASTVIVGVIGHPVEHSLSPYMHNAAIETLGLNWCYVAFHVLPDRVGDAIRGMRGLNIHGLNVTVPHKQAVMPFLDEISEDARTLGAVNTISNEDGCLIGDNTDVYGILTSLRETAELETLPRKILVLGAGGAARGVVYALTTVQEVEEITVLNRTPSKAQGIAEEIGRAAGEKRIKGGPLSEKNLRRELDASELLINTTSVGMFPRVDQSPIQDWDVFRSDLTVYDIVFNPPETVLMHQAKTAGARTFGGIEMLIYQGARSFEIWSKRQAPIPAMKEAVSDILHRHPR